MRGQKILGPKFFNVLWELYLKFPAILLARSGVRGYVSIERIERVESRSIG